MGRKKKLSDPEMEWRSFLVPQLQALHHFSATDVIAIPAQAITTLETSPTPPNFLFYPPIPYLSLSLILYLFSYYFLFYSVQSIPTTLSLSYAASKERFFFFISPYPLLSNYGPRYPSQTRITIEFLLTIDILTLCLHFITVTCTFNRNFTLPLNLLIKQLLLCKSSLAIVQ